MDAPGDLGAVEAALRILDALDLVAEQRRIDELGPDIERVDHRRPEIAESPGLVGMDGKVAVAVAQRLVEVDHAAHETRRKDTDATEVEQIERTVRPDAEIGRASGRERGGQYG